jgi:hypothetical protein
VPSLLTAQDLYTITCNAGLAGSTVMCLCGRDVLCSDCLKFSDA